MGSRTKPGRSATPVAVKAIELGVAAPQVVMHRVARMMSAGPVLSARDRKEFEGMVTEKQTAFTQSLLGVWAEGLRAQQGFVVSLLNGATPAEHSAQSSTAAARMADSALAPIHRKAVANAKRLARGGR